nr:pentapeptide repeat-containing protein [Lonsdalea quercina]
MASSVKDCDFTGANMESTRLSATKFLDVDLKHCNFNGADIFASEFSHTDLTNANFERVKLALSTLDGAISTLDGGEITQAELFEDF